MLYRFRSDFGFWFCPNTRSIRGSYYVIKGVFANVGPQRRPQCQNFRFAASAGLRNEPADASAAPERIQQRARRLRQASRARAPSGRGHKKRSASQAGSSSRLEPPARSGSFLVCLNAEFCDYGLTPQHFSRSITLEYSHFRTLEKTDVLPDFYNI